MAAIAHRRPPVKSPLCKRPASISRENATGDLQPPTTKPWVPTITAFPTEANIDLQRLILLLFIDSVGDKSRLWRVFSGTVATVAVNSSASGSSNNLEALFFICYKGYGGIGE
ncbi:MAG: hypothetical protein Q9159_005939 [Coniocarpon cinnabarinum]